MKKRIIISSLVLILFLLIGIGYLVLGEETRDALNISINGVWDIVLGVTIIIIGIIVFFLFLYTDALKKLRKFGRRYWYIFLIWDISKWILLIILSLIVLKGASNISQSLIG